MATIELPTECHELASNQREKMSSSPSTEDGDSIQVSPFECHLLQQQIQLSIQERKCLQKLIVKDLIIIYQSIQMPMDCLFNAYALLCDHRMEPFFKKIENQSETQLKLISIALMMINYKQFQKSELKYTISELFNVLNWDTFGIKIEDIIKMQGSILNAFQFDIISPSIYSLIGDILHELKITSIKTIKFIEYILQLSFTANYKEIFFSSKPLNQVTLALATIKLSFHFKNILIPNSLINKYKIDQQTLQKKCQKLFSLLLKAKEKYPCIYRKYSSKDYERVSQIKLIHINNRSEKCIQLTGNNDQTRSSQKSIGSESK